MRVVLECPDDLLEWAVREIQRGLLLAACPKTVGDWMGAWSSATPDRKMRVSRLKDGGVKVRVEREATVDVTP